MSLPIELWRREMGYHPWHFWGMRDSAKLKLTSACNAVVCEHPWQNADRISRSEIRQSILEAEARLREYLLFSVGRRWVTETLQFPRPAQSGQQYTGFAGGDGRWLPIFLSEGYVRAAGVEVLSAVDTAVDVTLSDEDGDGVNDTFTLTVSTSVTDTDELEIFFQASDRLDGDEPSERYRIAPVKISISGGVATIKGPAYLLLRPIRAEGFDTVNGFDPTESGVLATALDVYRHYTDPTGTTTDTSQAVLVWETSPYPSWAVPVNSSVDFGGNLYDPAATAIATARVQIRNERLGIVAVGSSSYSSNSGAWGTGLSGATQPDRIIIRYEAGIRLASVETTNGLSRLNGRWDAIVARLACSELKRRDFGCERALESYYRWSFDQARSAAGNGEEFRLSEQALNNPFGTAAGAVYAWNQVKNYQITRAFLP